MVANGKTDFEAQRNEEDMYPKNNIAQLYLKYGWSDLHWNFPSGFRDASDIYKFPAQHMVQAHFLLEDLWVSEPSSGELGKFQHRSDHPYIKYNCAILFLGYMFFFIFLYFKICFLHRQPL